MTSERTDLKDTCNRPERYAPLRLLWIEYDADRPLAARIESNDAVPLTLEYAATRQEAIDRLSRRPHPDAVVICLPPAIHHVNGNITPLIRASDEVPVIAVTPYDTLELCSEAVRHGAGDCLAPDELTPHRLARIVTLARCRSQRNRAHDDLVDTLSAACNDLGISAAQSHGDMGHVVQALRESNELLERMFANLHVHAAYLDPDFNFIRVNDAYALANRRRPAYFVGKNHFELFPHAENEAIFREVLQSGEPRFFFEKPFENPQMPEQSVTWWDWGIQPVKDEWGEVSGLVLTLIDVTQRVATRRRIEAERRRLDQLLRMLPGYVLLVDGDYRIRFANQRFADLFGDLDGTTCYRAMRGRNAPCSPCRMNDVFTDGAPHEWEWTCAEGRIFHVWGIPFDDADGNRQVLELGIDITERKRLEKRILDVVEAERRRIGQDLHDTLGQNLTGVAFMLEALAQQLSDRPQAAEMVLSVCREINKATVQSRTIARGLCPVGLNPDSFDAGLREFAEHVEAVYGVPCRYTPGDESLVRDALAAGNLYSIVQEAVTNAVRHAGASWIEIAVDDTPEGVRLAVRDNGRGLPENVEQSAGMGLHTMRYRAEAIGARFDIRPDTDRGTVVSCLMPHANSPAPDSGER